MPFEAGTAAAALLYVGPVVLPGLAVLRLVGVRPADRLVGLGLAAGVGLALQPLAYLWAHALGPPLGPAAVWLALGAAAAYLAAPALRARVPGGSSGWARRPSPATLALAGIVVAVLASRAWAVREVSVPLWGDSVHHAMIVRLFTTHGGLVDDWQPLAPLSTFSYHFGLHAGVASLSWASGLPAHRALLVAGQLLMVLQLLTAYALAAGLTGRPWAGVGAALAASGLSPMPAYYVNWGRYTQLAGQVVLPAAALATVWAAGAWSPSRGADGDGPKAPARAAAARDLARRVGLSPEIALAALLVAGLALTHYLVTLFYALFVAAWVVVGPHPASLRSAADLTPPRWRGAAPLRTAPERGLEGRGGAGGRGEQPEAGSPPPRRSNSDQTSKPLSGAVRRGAAALWRGGVRPATLARLALVAGLAVALASPWLPQFGRGLVGGNAATVLTSTLPNADVFGVVPAAFAWGDNGANVGLPLAVAAALAGAWGLARGVGAVRLGVAWTALLVLAAYPRLFGLPITGPLKDFTVVIGLYVPAGLVIGGALGELAERWRAARPSAEAMLAAGTVALGVALAWAGRDPVDPSHALVTPADLEAIAWVRENTPPEATFLVSSLPAFGDTIVVGDDAGWWLPLLADRRTTLPPATYGQERSFEAGYRERVNALARSVAEDLDGPAARAALDAAGVTHAFVGARARALDAARLEASPGWRTVYAEDGVAVFERREDPARD